MIALWMLYCLGIGLAFSMAGYALERGLQYAGRPTRWAWVIALVGSYVLPVAAWVRPEAFSTFTAPMSTVVDYAANSSITTSTIFSNPTQPQRRPFSLTGLDEPLRWGWGIGSFALVLTLGTAALRLVALRRRWRPAAVDGRDVLVSSDVGPAVVGLWSPQVVVPAWALDLPEAERELMLAHEEQHICAGDPALIASGFVLVLLAPWNIALWWQWRRLRLAVEIDCDARVLGQGQSASAYGDLLIRVGQRRSPRMLGVAAFGEPVSFLESRIRRMLAQLPRWRWAGAAAALAVAVGALVAACETPRPVGPAIERVESGAASHGGFAGLVSVETDPSASGLVDQAPALLLAPPTAYPQLPRLAGIQGFVVVRARIETSGHADPVSITVLESPHPAYAAAARSAVLHSTFRPARFQGRTVAALVRITYEFANAESNKELAFDVTDRLTLKSAQRLRPAIERYVGGSAVRWAFPSLLDPNGPPMDVFLIADASLQVYRSSSSTLYYLGTARPTSEIGVGDLKSAAPFFDPGRDGWLVVDPRALQGLVRDNVRVIWIHHDPAPQDTAVTPEMRQYLSDKVPDMRQRGELVRRLARQYHPEVFGQYNSPIAIALVLDAHEQVLAHAAHAGEARASDGRYASGESCLDVLTRLVPAYQKAQWSQSGCAGDTQKNIIVYWGQLLHP